MTPAPRNAHLNPVAVLRPLLLTIVFLTGTALGQGLNVVVTIAPYSSLVTELLAERGTVSVLLPAGASPHTFEPTPRQAAELAHADLVVMNGGLDEWLHGLLDAAGGDVRIVEAVEAAHELLEEHAAEGTDGHAEGESTGEEEHAHDEDHGHEEDHTAAHHAEEAGEGEPHGEDGHDHSGFNPHIWLDPTLVIPVVAEIAHALAEVDPANSRAYLDRAEVLIADLRALDEELSALLAPVAGAPFVPFHDAWPYFAERYGLDLIVELEPFPGREPSPAYLANALTLIRESGAPAIFAEVGLSRRPAEVLADEAGVALFVLDPLGAPGEPYRELLLRNAEVIREALSQDR